MEYTQIPTAADILRNSGLSLPSASMGNPVQSVKPQAVNQPHQLQPGIPPKQQLFDSLSDMSIDELTEIMGRMNEALLQKKFKEDIPYILQFLNIVISNPEGSVIFTVKNSEGRTVYDLFEFEPNESQPNILVYTSSASNESIAVSPTKGT